jgi:hypothetical protein
MTSTARAGLKGTNKAKLFELRFGYALQLTGATPRYEVPGEGQSTLDFGFTSGGREFLVELMRLEETAAVKAAHGERRGRVWRQLGEAQPQQRCQGREAIGRR